MSKEICLTVDNIEVIDNEPRIKDVVLGERLGLKKTRDVRVVIKSNMAELLAYGCAPLVTAHEKIGFVTRQTEAYYLNEPQALLICMFSRTQKAAAVRKELVDVYMAYRTQGLTKVKEHYRQVGRKESLPAGEDSFGSLYKNALHAVLDEEGSNRKEYQLSDYEAQVIEKMRSWRAYFGANLMLELEERLKK